ETVNFLVALIGRRETEALHDRAQDDLHHVQREARADAGTHAAAERNVRIPARWVLQEALGTEPIRLGVKILAPVEDVAVECDQRAGWELVLAECKRLLEGAHDER